MPHEGPKRDSIVVPVAFSVVFAASITWAMQPQRTGPIRWQPILLGVAAAALASGTTIWAINRHRAKTYRPPWCCQKCGYDRTGIAANAMCPECGAHASQT